MASPPSERPDLSHLVPLDSIDAGATDSTSTTGDADTGARARPASAGRSHPGPPSKLARNLVVGTLIAFVVASYVGNAFMSVLVSERPLLFIAMNAQNRNLALAAGELDAWSFYVVGFLRLLGPDPLFFLLGRWYGDGAIRWMERTAPTYGELLRQLEKWFDKARIPVVAIAPNNPVCLFAGAAGMTWGAFMAANVVGTAVRLVLVRMFSSVFEDQLSSVRGFISDYRWPLLVLSIAMVGFTIWGDRRGGREDVEDLLRIEEEIEAIEAEEAAEAATPVSPDQGPAGTDPT